MLLGVKLLVGSRRNHNLWCSVDRPNFEAAFQYASDQGADENMRRCQVLLAKKLYMFRYCLGIDVRRHVVEFVRNRCVCVCVCVCVYMCTCTCTCMCTGVCVRGCVQS